MQRSLLISATALLGFMTSPVSLAIPMLQLDIPGASYDAVSADVYGSESLFTLHAYGKIGSVDVTKNYYVSAAISPAATSGTEFGSFSVNGSSYATADMTYGTPPIENFEEIQGHDSGDLGTHGIFDTLYKEIVFKWDINQTRSSVNVEDNPGTDPATNPGNDLYWIAWNFDVSGLTTGFGMHFDLYSTALKSCGNNLRNDFGGSIPSSCQDIDIDEKAPFSHDASVHPDRPPQGLAETSSISALLAGVLGLTVASIGRRRRASRCQPVR